MNLVENASHAIISGMAFVIEYGLKALSYLPLLIGCLVLFAFSRDIVPQIPLAFLEQSQPAVKLLILAAGVCWIRVEAAIYKAARNGPPAD